MNNSSIHRIEFQDKYGSYPIFNCSFRKQVEIHPYYIEHQIEIEKRLESVIGFLKSFGLNQHKPGLIIVESSTKIFMTSHQEVVLSKDLFKQDDHVERGLIKSWIEFQANKAADQFLIDSMTEFLFSLYKNKSLDAGLRWPKIPLTLDSYCESQFLSPEHFSYCSNFEELGQDRVTDLYLRKFIGQLLYESFLSLGPKKRLEVFQQLNLLFSLPHDEQRPSLRGSTILDLGYWLTEGILSWQSLMLENGFRDWSEALNETLKSRGASEFEGPPIFDVLLFVNFHKKDFNLTLEHLEKISHEYPQRVVGIVLNEKLRIFPSRAEMNLRSWGSLRANRAVFIQCGWPNLRTIQNFEGVTNKLVVIDHCYPQQSLNFEGYLKFGVPSLGLENPSMQFLSINLSTLRLITLRGQFANERFRSLPSEKQSEKFKTLLGWKGQQWVAPAAAYRTEALFKAIEWFKLPAGFLPSF